MMDPERWAAVEALCEAALERPASRRAAFLEHACREDPALHDEVRSLLAQLDRDPDFLEQPIASLGHSGPGDAGPLPEAIAGWRILRRLGRGGMGEVFLGERDGIRAAIKVLRADLASPDIRRRFALERRILESVSHPGIARMLDVAETTDGRPCFVLEYVPGIPITADADLRRLSIAARLGQWLSVADAVEHAHRHLVVHRDIKPANILVGEDGAPKLLDFGIGKVLGPEANLGTLVETAQSGRLLTLDYAAPEQLRGDVVTTATDVHALGVLLHELLTGVHPFRRTDATPGQVELAILEHEPDRPSSVVRPAPASGPVAEGDARVRADARREASPEALGRRLAGDLDNIVLMALRKEPARRYGSAAAFAEDVRRHLDGLPVRARPDTLGYRTRKFVRRNAGAVSLAAIALLGLLGTLAAALLESHRANRNAAQVVAERDEAVAVRGFLMEMFGATGGGQAVGGSETVRQLLDRQAARIDADHADDPLLAARLDEVVADAYDRLGLPAQAVPLADKALALRRAAQPGDHPDVAGAENLLGWVLHQSGDRAGAEPHLREAVAIRRSRHDSAGLARALNDLGVLLDATGRHVPAESALVEALALHRARDGDGDLGTGTTANNLAANYYYQGRYAEAGSTQDVALKALRASVGEAHQRTVIALSNLAAFRVAAGEFVEAERDYRSLLALQTRLQGPEHPVTFRVATALATVLGNREGPTRASALREADSLLVRVLAALDREGGGGAPQRGVTLDRLAGIRLARDDLDGALRSSTEAVSLLNAAGRARANDGAAATGRLGLIEARLGRRPDAMRHARWAVTELERAIGADAPETARAHGRLCQVMRLVGWDVVETTATCRAAVAALERAPGGYRADLQAARAASESR